MNVWNFEAAEIIDGQDLESCPIYRTPDIDEFLGGERSKKRIISGLKGTGKTLFLKMISYQYRHLGGVTLIPTTELTERLYSIDYDFSDKKARSWSSHERWKHVWRTVLSVVVLKAIRHSFPSEILEIFPDNLGISIGAHLSAAIQSREIDTSRFQELFSKMLDAAIQAINQPVALFVDNIDEAFARHSGYDLHRDAIDRQSQSGSHSYELWLSAQIGFMLAVRELTTRNAHLKLFGTVRSEAIRDNPTSTAFNMQSLVLDLRYNANELRGIFEAKLHRLREIDTKSFSRPEEPDPIKAFFPFDTIEHKIVSQSADQPYLEDVFDYIRRHTRGRPRELDFIGHDLHMTPQEARTPDRVRELVRDRSSKFFGFSKNEAVPFWDPLLDDLANKISSNFILQKDAINLSSELSSVGTGIEYWNSLRANGLCGAVVNVHPNKKEQHFSNHDVFADLSEADFLSSRIWVIHPCITINAFPRRKRYRPNPRNVAGHLYPFIPENTTPKSQKKHIHVLIGAGKLGFGLVIPMLLLDKQTNVLIVARDSEKWQKLLGAKDNFKQQLLIRFSKWQNPQQYNIKVVSDRQLDWQKTIQKFISRNRCVLLVMSEKSSLKYAVEQGNSVGISVGTKNIEEIVEDLAIIQCKAKVVLGFENDESALLKADTILRKHRKVLVPTVVDRICSEIEITEDGIEIRAEKHGKITAFVEKNNTKGVLPQVFLSGENLGVKVVTDRGKFSLIREQKKRLVNTLHATAAVMVHKALMDVGASKETANEAVLGLIANNMDIHIRLELIKDLLILSVLGTLPEDQLTDEILRSQIADLQDYGNDSLRRILSEPDAPSRVLQTDIQSLSSKYTRLFANVKDLALIALKNQYVKTVFPFDEREIDARLNKVNEAFIGLIAQLPATQTVKEDK